MKLDQCKPGDEECLNKQKLLPFHSFVDKLSRKMSYKGCTVAFSERNDALHGISSVGGEVTLSDIKTILKSSLSKSEHCDKLFEESWTEILAPHKASFNGSGGGGGIQIPEGMEPVVEKQISNLMEKTSEAEGMIVDEKEMEELLKKGKVEAMEGGLPSKLSKLLQGKCEQHMKDSDGLGQCLVDLNKEIKDMISDNIKSGKLSKLRKTGSEVEKLLDDISKNINRADMSLQDKIELKEFIRDLQQFKDVLKSKINEQIPKMDITPYFDDPEKEKEFVDQFMRGGIFNWGHPEFIGMVTNLDYFKSKIREGLKELKTRTGKKDFVREKGKLIHGKATIMDAMRKGAVMDLLYKVKPPKQKEDIIWLVDTSGSMTTAFSFIQPVVDGLNNLGIKQKFFLGTEEGLEVAPNSNFTETLEKLKTGGTVLSQAYDDIKPKVGTFKDKTFIIYSDMQDFSPKDFEEKLNNVVSEGGKVLLLNSQNTRAWGDKYLKAQLNRDPIVEFDKVDNYNRMIEVLKDAKSIIKK